MPSEAANPSARQIQLLEAAYAYALGHGLASSHCARWPRPSAPARGC